MSRVSFEHNSVCGIGTRPIPSIRDKDQFLILFIEVINDKELKTGTLASGRKLLKSITVFAHLLEACSSTSISRRSWR